MRAGPMWFGIVELTIIRPSPERNLTPGGLTAFRQGGQRRVRFAVAPGALHQPAVRVIPRAAAVISGGHDVNMTFACSLGTKFAKMDAQA
jgi:hypothetical protein